MATSFCNEPLMDVAEQVRLKKSLDENHVNEAPALKATKLYMQWEKREKVISLCPMNSSRSCL